MRSMPAMQPLLQTPHTFVCTMRGDNAHALVKAAVSMTSGGGYEGLTIVCPREWVDALVTTLEQQCVRAAVVPVEGGDGGGIALRSMELWELVAASFHRAVFAVVFDENCRLLRGPPLHIGEVDAAGCCLYPHEVRLPESGHWVPDDVNSAQATLQQHFWVAGLSIWRISSLRRALQASLPEVMAYRLETGLSNQDLLMSMSFETITWAAFDQLNYTLGSAALCTGLASFRSQGRSRVGVRWTDGSMEE